MNPICLIKKVRRHSFGTMYFARFIFLGLISIQASVAYSKVLPLSENHWGNPEFVDNFLGSYGVISAVEPPINYDIYIDLRRLQKSFDKTPLEAVEKIKSRAAAEDKSAVYDFLLGQVLYEQRKETEALTAYLKAVSKFPNFARAHKNIAHIYMANNQCKDAKNHLLKLVNLSQTDAHVFGYLGYCALQEKRFGDAASFYQIAKIYQPNNRDWKLGEAQAQMGIDNYESAEAVLDDLLSIDALNVDYLLLQANVHAKQQAYNKAIINLELVRRLQPQHWEALTLLGDLYLKTNLPELASIRYSQSIGKGTSIDYERAVTSFYNLVNSGASWADLEAYFSVFEDRYASQAQRENKDEFNLMKAQGFLQAGNADKALQLVEKVLSQNPLNISALLLGGKSAMSKGELDRAELYYERTIHNHPRKYQGLIGLGQVLAKKRNFKAALTAFESAYALNESESLLENIRLLSKVVGTQRN